MAPLLKAQNRIFLNIIKISPNKGESSPERESCFGEVERRHGGQVTPRQDLETLRDETLVGPADLVGEQPPVLIHLLLQGRQRVVVDSGQLELRQVAKLLRRVVEEGDVAAPEHIALQAEKGKRS